ncbi:hypothetical protein RHSIM_Rhsim03G0191600 [Rhododendron simsii]|uniref:HMG box domain-containing protein n=1 Tax=Rhododendron simsii TaxID=118357 RepID=A0A834H9Y2_RHOSS|nr:hypothetical protein RHSIM_Rhsim03G0191600 [Rhododendron simsii]
MSRGQKRPRTEEVSEAFKGRTMTNPYLIFKKEFIQGVREAEPSTTYILKMLTKRAAKRWKEMPEADKALYIRSANEAKAKNSKEKRKTTVLVEHFNPKTRTLEFGRLRTYEITTVDVARALEREKDDERTDCENDGSCV